MNIKHFCLLLESMTLLTERQKSVILKALSPEEEGEEEPTTHSLLLQRMVVDQSSCLW